MVHEALKVETLMESAADHYRRLGTTSLCSGLALECLVSFEKYRKTEGNSALKTTIPECQKFVTYTIAAIKEEEAPYSIRRIYRELLARKSVDKKNLLKGWQTVQGVILNIQENKKPDEKHIRDSISFLKTAISEFNDIGEHLEKKLYASSWSTRELV
jgi:hypothetical protein